MAMENDHYLRVVHELPGYLQFYLQLPDIFHFPFFYKVLSVQSQKNRLCRAEGILYRLSCLHHISLNITSYYMDKGDLAIYNQAMIMSFLYNNQPYISYCQLSTDLQYNYRVNPMKKVPS